MVDFIQNGDYDNKTENTNFNITIYNVKDDSIGLALIKRNAVNDEILKGYEFSGFYANADGTPNYDDPVVDNYNIPMIWTYETNTFEFTPKDFATTNEWNLVFVETKAPNPTTPGLDGRDYSFEYNKGNAYSLNITKDENSKLHVNNENGTSHGNTSTFLIYNNADNEITIKIRKIDFDSKLPLKGYNFKAYHLNKNGNADFNNPLIDVYGNEVEIYNKIDPVTGNEISKRKFTVNPILLGGNPDITSGKVALVETQAPEGYSLSEGRTFILQVNQNPETKQWYLVPVADEYVGINNSNGNIAKIKNEEDAILKLKIDKVDKTYHFPLKNYEFKAYYAEPSGLPNSSTPVLDLDDNEVYLYDKLNDDGEREINNSFTFTPVDYKTKTSWDIVFVETKAPANYYATSYTITVTKQDDGILVVEEGSVPATKTDEYEYTLLLENIREPDPEENRPPSKPNGTEKPTKTNKPSEPPLETPINTPKPSEEITPVPSEEPLKPTPNPSNPPKDKVSPSEEVSQTDEVTPSDEISPTENENLEPDEVLDSTNSEYQIPEGYYLVYDKDNDYYIVYDENDVPLGYVKNPEDFITFDDIIPFGTPNFKNNPETSDKSQFAIFMLITLLGFYSIVLFLKKKEAVKIKSKK